ncbi:MAG: helix-turn-helix transcriptional regulator [Phycisphaeraceae bacterium]
MFESSSPGESTDHRDARPQSPPPQRSVPPLSPTEKKVCALLLERYTEQRIADFMQRSPNTIHVHVRNIYRKLGVRTRKELLHYPGVYGLIGPRDNQDPE